MDFHDDKADGEGKASFACASGVEVVDSGLGLEGWAVGMTVDDPVCFGF